MTHEQSTSIAATMSLILSVMMAAGIGFGLHNFGLSLLTFPIFLIGFVVFFSSLISKAYSKEEIDKG